MQYQENRNGLLAENKTVKLPVYPWEVLGISSDRDDQRIFFGFEIFDFGIFLGTKIWQVFFWVA